MILARCIELVLMQLAVQSTVLQIQHHQTQLRRSGTSQTRCFRFSMLLATLLTSLVTARVDGSFTHN